MNQQKNQTNPPGRGGPNYIQNRTPPRRRVATPARGLLPLLGNEGGRSLRLKKFGARGWSKNRSSFLGDGIDNWGNSKLFSRK